MRRRRRRPGRAVRPRHLRRGLRRHRPAAARACRRDLVARGAGHGHAGRPGAAHRPPVRVGAHLPTTPPPSCRRSSPASSAARRSPRCSPVPSTPSGRLPVSVPRGRRRPARRPTSPRRSAAATRSRRSTRPPRTRSGTGCRLHDVRVVRRRARRDAVGRRRRRSEVEVLVDQHRRPRRRRRGPALPARPGRPGDPARSSRLIGSPRVELPPGRVGARHLRRARRRHLVHRARGDRVVEPGDVELRVARSSAEVHEVVPLVLVGGLRTIGIDRVLLATSRVGPAIPERP